MDRIENRINQICCENDSDDVYTPASIAWKLLMDDIDDSLSANLMAMTPDNDEDSDPVSFLFEILITIFMEMIFDLAIINNEIDNDNGFNPDISKFNINDFLPILEKKFNRVSILLNINTYDKKSDDHENLRNILDNRYCRVILRHCPEDSHIFKKNNIPSELNYHIILNQMYKQKSDLKNIYAIIIIENIIYKISFNLVKKINTSRC